jgi:site-specific DNA-methyltransferase (adenine-specific)
MNDECLADYKYYFSDRFNLFKGDSRQVLPLMKDNSIDSIVCDPPYELGFMGKSWDSTGIANDPKLWKEVLRVLKPGGHLLAFSGSRTYHRMAVAIEDAGFEIRDQIMWVYGSGFPKSHNISKGIDKAAGAEREVVGRNPNSRENATKDNTLYESGTVGKTDYITTAATAAAKQWQGWGTALKPAHEPIVLARKPVEGTVVNNVLTYSVGGINIDGTRVGSEGGSTRGDKPSTHLSPSGAFNTGHDILKLDAGRFPANFIHDGSDEVNELLGEPARFFYCAKANKRDRNEGVENNHPTVKPTDLMQYLCRLITPPNGTILDPFLGSGSTGKAAMYEGFNFVGIELTQEYLPIAKARIEFALNNKNN